MDQSALSMTAALQVRLRNSMQGCAACCFAGTITPCMLEYGYEQCVLNPVVWEIVGQPVEVEIA